jgi:hypothetical protein
MTILTSRLSRRSRWQSFGWVSFTPSSAPALSAKSPSAVEVGIDFSKFMPPKAMRFARVGSGQSLAPLEIRSTRNWFKMCGIHAMPNAAQVVKLQAFFNRSNEQLISEAMGTVRLPVNVDDSVSSIGNVPCPQPTTRSNRFYSAPKALLGWYSLKNHPENSYRSIYGHSVTWKERVTCP